MSGAGLIKVAPGTLVLTDANTFGFTRVNGGTVVGNTTSLSGNTIAAMGGNA